MLATETILREGFVLPSPDALQGVYGEIGKTPVVISMKRCACVCSVCSACKCNCTCGSCNQPRCGTGKCPW